MGQIQALTRPHLGHQSAGMNSDVSAPRRDAKGRLLPGQRLNPRGREKGKPNKVPGAVREMLHEALHRAGGADYLYGCATSEETSIRVAFLGLIKSVIPKEVTVEAGQTLEDLLEAAHRRRLEADRAQQDATVIDITPSPAVELEPDADEQQRGTDLRVASRGQAPRGQQDPQEEEAVQGEASSLEDEQPEAGEGDQQEGVSLPEPRAEEQGGRSDGPADGQAGG